MTASNRAVRIAVTAVVVAAVAVGCAERPTGSQDRTDPSMGTQQRAEKNGTGERRTDLAPLTDRFTALQSPQGATWYSGTLGSDAAPGPSSHWIDAVIELSEEDVAALVDQYGPSEATTSPQVVDDLRGDVPDGTLLSDVELDRAFSTSGFVSQVWVDREGRRLVLTAKGQ